MSVGVIPGFFPPNLDGYGTPGKHESKNEIHKQVQRTSVRFVSTRCSNEPHKEGGGDNKNWKRRDKVFEATAGRSGKPRGHNQEKNSGSDAGVQGRVKAGSNRIPSPLAEKNRKSEAEHRGAQHSHDPQHKKQSSLTKLGHPTTRFDLLGRFLG
jgi:hypothetical protein